MAKVEKEPAIRQDSLDIEIDENAACMLLPVLAFSKPAIDRMFFWDCQCMGGFWQQARQT